MLLYNTLMTVTRELSAYVENGEEFPAVVDVGGALIVKEEPEVGRKVTDYHDIFSLE